MYGKQSQSNGNNTDGNVPTGIQQKYFIYMGHRPIWKIEPNSSWKTDFDYNIGFSGVVKYITNIYNHSLSLD